MTSKETKAKLPDRDEDPVVAIITEEYDGSKLTRNPRDMIKNGAFEIDSTSRKTSQQTALATVEVTKLDTVGGDFKKLAKLPKGNYLRPCPTASKVSLQPCPTKFEIRVFPQGDRPRVAELISKGYIDLPVPGALLKQLGKRLMVKKSDLVAYRSSGLHYPTRLSLLNSDDKVMPMAGVSYPLTNFDTKLRPAGVHVMPDQDEVFIVSGDCDMGSCDLERAAWFGRLAKLNPKQVRQEIELLPRWPGLKDKDVLKVALSDANGDYNFVQWMAGHFWLYCWYQLVQYLARQNAQIDEATLPTPREENGVTVVPVHRKALIALLGVMIYMSGRKWTVRAQDGFKLRLGFDKESQAYQKLVQDRKDATAKGDRIEYDDYTELFDVFFDIKVEFLRFADVDKDIERGVNFDDEEDADDGDSGDTDTDWRSLIPFEGQVRPLRGTPGFHQKP